MKRPCPFAAAESKRRAAELVGSWPLETLHDAGASTRLVASWGLEPDAAQQLVTLERRRRPSA